MMLAIISIVLFLFVYLSGLILAISVMREGDDVKLRHILLWPFWFISDFFDEDDEDGDNGRSKYVSFTA
jgi:hypothetical protein